MSSAPFVLTKTAGAGATVAQGVATGAVALLFFLYGARLSTREALDGLRHWRLHLTVLTCTFVVFPVLGLAARALVPSVLTPPLHSGLLFLCVVPSTIQSSIAFTSIARGNVPAAICAGSFSSLAGISETNTTLQKISEQLTAQTQLLKDIKAATPAPAPTAA